MNTHKIGVSAGTVWQLLNGENRKWEYQEIKEKTGLSDRYLNAAIGWLAREDKIQIEECENSTDVFYYLELNYYIG